MSKARKSYPSDVSDAEWEFLAPFLALMREDAPQRQHPLRALVNGMRYVAKTGCPWRFLPSDLPPWAAVYQQARRWFDAGVFEQVSHELRVIARIMEGRNSQPTAAIPDARTVQPTPESGGRGGYDGAKKRKGSEVHVAGDTPGNLLALAVTPANAGDREQVEELARRVQEGTGRAVEIAFVGRGSAGDEPAAAAEAEGIRLAVVRHNQPKRGFVLPPRRRVVERTSGGLARFRRLARDYERLGSTLEGWHWLASLVLLLGKVGIEPSA